jgi:hypothetical protein
MVALLLAALFQSAAPASVIAAPSAPPAKAARVVCRKETVVGSTIKKKICSRKLVEEVAQGDKIDAAQMAQPTPK